MKRTENKAGQMQLNIKNIPVILMMRHFKHVFGEIKGLFSEILDFQNVNLIL